VSESGFISESTTQINRHVLDRGFQGFPVVANSLGKNTFVSCEAWIAKASKVCSRLCRTTRSSCHIL